MANKSFNASTVPSNKTVVTDTLRPSSEMHILVGGPYTLNGESHRYGHTAVRIKTLRTDTTYDFGRYGRVTGEFGAEGEGILRIWSDFSVYIRSENAFGRTTTGFVYALFDHQASAVNEHFRKLAATGIARTDLERGRTYIKVYHLPANYHALRHNCTTLSLDGARAAFSKFEYNSRDFIKPGDVLTFAELMAMKTVGGGTPNRIFLPSNLQAFLSSSMSQRPVRIDIHGKK